MKRIVAGGKALEALGVTRSVNGSCVLFSGLFDYSVRTRHVVRWDSRTVLLGGLQIDDELELPRLFHWEVGGLRALQYLVDHRRDSLKRFGRVGPVGHQADAIHKISPRVNRRQP